jgi:CheY-like chemotaxis protein
MPQGGRIVISTRNIRQTVPQATTAHPDLPPGHYVRVAVTDTGSGMDAHTAAKAFEPFFTTKEVGKGTGLGLSQVYGFAKQAGGDVRIVSAPGEGTTVELLLPREEEPAARPAATAVAPLRDVSGEVVLVVEDEAAVRDIVVDCLQELGYATIEAASGPAALDMLRSGQRVDVLFSDVVMPGGIDGFRLRTEARRLRPGLRVLLTSGYPGSFDRTQDADVALLTKPYDRGQLASFLSSVLQA